MFVFHFDFFFLGGLGNDITGALMRNTPLLLKADVTPLGLTFSGKTME